MAFTVFINGVERTSLVFLPGGGGLRYALNTRATGSVSLALFAVNDGAAAYRPTLGHACVVKNNGVDLVNGAILDMEEKGFTDTESGWDIGVMLSLTLADQNRLPGYAIYTKTYVSGTTLKAILQDLITAKLGAYGITLDAGQANGPSLTAELSFISSHVDAILDALQNLHGWVRRISPALVLSMIQPGVVSSGITLQDSDTDLIGGVSFRRSRSANYANTVQLSYGPAAALVIELTRATNGVTASWVLPVTGTPIGYVDVNSVAKTVGPGAQYTWDAATRTLAVGTDPIPPAGSLTFPLTVLFPQVASASDAPALAADGYAIERQYTDGLETNPDTAIVKTAALLRRAIAASAAVVSVTHRRAVAYPGETVVLTFAEHAITGTYMIVSVDVNEDVDGEAIYTFGCVAGAEMPDTWLDHFRGGGASASGSIAGDFSVSGGGSELNASNLTSGTVPLARLVDIADAQIAAAAAFAWSKISKVGSSLADLITRSAADLSSGTLAVARLPLAIPAANIANGFVLDAEYQYLDGVTSAIQTQLNDRLVKPHVRSSGWVTFFGPFGGDIFVGLPGGVTSVGTISDGTTVDRQFINRTTAATIDAIAGWRVNTFSVVQSRHNPLLRALIRTGPSVSVVRIFVGFSSFDVTADAPVVGGAPAAVGVQFSTSRGDAGWRGMSLYSAGTSGAADQSLTAALVAVAADTDYDVTVSLTGDGTLATFTVNGLSATLSTNLPAGSKNMGFQERHVTLDAAAKTVALSRFYLEWE